MRNIRPRRRGNLVALALAGALVACASERRSLWVEDLAAPTQREDSEYRIAPGDVLGVRVWNQASMSTERARVRDDGKVSLPFLQDVDSAGMTLSELSSRLAVKVKTYVSNPIVTVTLEERRPLQVSVLGEVTRAGIYELRHSAGVLDALAAAGGLTQWARRDGIYVLREGGGSTDPPRIRFQYERLASGKGAAATFKLRSGDVVLVE